MQATFEVTHIAEEEMGLRKLARISRRFKSRSHAVFRFPGESLIEAAWLLSRLSGAALSLASGLALLFGKWMLLRRVRDLPLSHRQSPDSAAAL